MNTKAGLIKFGLGEMSAAEVVAACPRLIELSDVGEQLCAQKNASANDRETVRVFEAFLAMAGAAPTLEKEFLP